MTRTDADRWAASDAPHACAPDITALLAPVAALVVLLAGCRHGPDVEGPFRGQIVEAETERPIEGAVVVVAWTHLMNWFEGGRREVDAREAVTDSQGRWEIPARARSFWEGGVAGVGTRFYMFAPGYEAVEDRVIPAGGQERREPTVTLMRRLATREQRCARLPYVSGVMSSVTAARSPHFVNAIARERLSARCSEVEGVRP